MPWFDIESSKNLRFRDVAVTIPVTKALWTNSATSNIDYSTDYNITVSSLLYLPSKTALKDGLILKSKRSVFYLAGVIIYCSKEYLFPGK